MRNRILTNANRTIKKSFPRFVSLLVMSMLGVFAFSGLKATAPDMIGTLDNYLDKYNAYDLKIVSDMGLTDSDITSLISLENIEKASGTYSCDISVTINESDYVLNVSSFDTDINVPSLIEGRMPEKSNEIVVEENMLTVTGMSLGDVISFGEGNLLYNNFTIVGIVDSCLYYNNASLSSNRGKTSVGAGTVNFYSFVNKDAFSQDYYSNIYLTVKDCKKYITSYSEYVALVDNAKDSIDKIKNECEEERYLSLYNDAKEEIDKEAEDKREEINEKRNEIEEAHAKINIALKELSETYKDSPEMYEYAVSELKKQEEEINSAVSEIDSKEEELNNAVKEAYAEIDKIKYPTWYVYDRTAYSTYTDYIDDAGSIDNLSKVFPTVFYLVAILVSLISMNRMVEEDRLEIGTLKSLGFSNRRIMTKYLLFSFLATVVGGVLGSVLGLIIIPSMIFGIYTILFDIPDFILTLNPGSTLVGFFITVICVCGSSIWTVCKVLKEKPAELMRPKAPANGKRVFLEKIGFLWKHISFSKKVIIRNLFRYKKRVFVTVGGITGCAALMLCGFGIRDAISDISRIQFGEIFTYDGSAYVSGDVEEQNIEKLFEEEGIYNVTKTERINATVNDISCYILAFDEGENISDIINLKDNNTKETVNPESGKAIITSKFSELTGLSKGDRVSIVDVDSNAYEYEISDVVTNYIDHYIFVDKNTLEQSGVSYRTNIVFFNTIEGTDEEVITSKLLENDEILNVTFMSTLIESVDNMLKSLNNVVLILIVLSAALAFVVLYNLSNININERKREIATLKVLGFYDKEVDDYITKETIIFTALGIALGLLAGFFLTRIVVSTVEIEKCRFIYEIKPMSYVYTAAFSVLFTFLVNFITHFSLKRINMIDSLKSVE